MGQQASNATSISAGSLSLSGPRFKELQFQLTELSAHRCRGQIDRSQVEAELGFKWKGSLRSGMPVQAKVAIPPILALEGSGVLVRHLEFERTVEVEISFVPGALAHQTVISKEGYRVLLEHFSLARIPVPEAPAPEREAGGQPKQALTGTAILRSGIDVQASVHHFLQNKKIGEILVHFGFLTEPQLEEALQESKVGRERLGRNLVRRQKITTEVLCHALALQSGLPVIDLAKMEISDALCSLFPYSMLREYGCIPFEESRASISMACSENLSPAALQVLEGIGRRKLKLFLASEELLALELDLASRRHKPRKFTRYKAAHPVRFQFSNRMGAPVDATFYEGVTHNIGVGGFAVHGHTPIPAALLELPRSSMYVQLALQDPLSSLKSICQLRWIRDAADAEYPKAWLLGMEIVEISPTGQECLLQLCQEAAHAHTSGVLRAVSGEPIIAEPAARAGLQAIIEEAPPFGLQTIIEEAPQMPASGNLAAVKLLSAEKIHAQLRALGLVEDVLIHEQDPSQFFQERGIQELGRGAEGAVYFLRGHVVKVANATGATAALREAAHMMYLNRALKGGAIGERERTDWPALLWIYALSNGSLAIGMRPFDAAESGGGSTLEVRLNCGPELNCTLIARMLRALVKSLTYAHDRGIIHHDLKPANIYLPADEAQSPVIFDLGQALWKNPNWGKDWLKHEHNAPYWYNGTFRYMHYRRRLAQLGAIATVNDRLPTSRQAQALELFQPTFFDDIFAFARIIRDLLQSPHTRLENRVRERIEQLYQNLMKSASRDGQQFQRTKTDRFRMRPGSGRGGAQMSALYPVVGQLEPKNPTMQQVSSKVEEALKGL